jgi:hypothetical protein
VCLVGIYCFFGLGDDVFAGLDDDNTVLVLESGLLDL